MEFETTMIGMLRILMEKIGSMHEHIGNVSREMEILKKNNQIKMLEIKRQ